MANNKKLRGKVLKKIKEKEKELLNLKKAGKTFVEKNTEKFGEDLGFLNIMNPFYKKQYNSNKDFAGILFFATQEARLETEIEELKDLLK